MIDSGLVGRKVFFMVRSHVERRYSILEPTQSRISPIVLKCTKKQPHRGRRRIFLNEPEVGVPYVPR